MRRHDAFVNLDVMAERGPEEPIPGMQFPVPVVGPHSPTVLALRMLVRACLAFGCYLFALRLVYLVSPDLVRFVASALAAVFLIALAVHWFSADRAMPEWPVWVGATVLVLYCADSFLPALGFLAGVPAQGSLAALVGPLVQAAVVVLVLAHFLLPAVKRTTSGFSRGPLTVGFVVALLGGKFGAATYYPESDFSAWTTFAMWVLFSSSTSMLVADQYSRFQEAMDPTRRIGRQRGWKAWFRETGVKASWAMTLVLLVALWFGNVVFVDHLGWMSANVLGLAAFLFLLFLWTWVRDLENPLRPYRAAWSALSFFLTYNLQRVSNPNVYQLARPFREPLGRLALVAFTSGFLSVGLLHLGGVHAPPGSNHPRLSVQPLATYCLPQCYPSLFPAAQMSEGSRAMYCGNAEKLAAEGDAPVPAATPVRSLAGLAVRAVLALAGGPLLFFFLLATTQGHFLAAKEGRSAGG